MVAVPPARTTAYLPEPPFTDAGRLIEPEPSTATPRPSCAWACKGESTLVLTTVLSLTVGQKRAAAVGGADQESAN